jgi:SAM-dependent methyltransferase
MLCLGRLNAAAFRMRNVTHRDAREDWRRFAAAAIPSKESTPHLDRFLADVAATATGQPSLALLDIGCGDGRLTKRLHDRGFSVTGVDVSPAAVHAAQALAATIDEMGRPLRFHEADMAADDPPRLDAAPFDVVVCQLVLSIIGDEGHRRNLLRHARSNLVPGGWLYLSASGVSDAINPGYARLYAADFPQTGERHTYYSRDAEGQILYATHHFTSEELASLLEQEGFIDSTVTIEREVSSRRPDEAAYFLYATCRNGSHTPRIRSPISL